MRSERGLLILCVVTALLSQCLLFYTLYDEHKLVLETRRSAADATSCDEKLLRSYRAWFAEHPAIARRYGRDL